MRIESSTATASGQIKDASDRIKSIEWHARAHNKNNVVVGDSNATLESGRELVPDATVTWNFALVDREGSVRISDLYVVLDGDSKVDWTVLKES
jgi:hypothetical protein